MLAELACCIIFYTLKMSSQIPEDILVAVNHGRYRKHYSSNNPESYRKERIITRLRYGLKVDKEATAMCPTSSSIVNIQLTMKQLKMVCV